MKDKKKDIKILITDPIHKDGIKLLKSNGFKIKCAFNLPREKLKKIIKGYHGLICRTATKVDEEVFKSAENLEFIGLASTGFDRIDIESATKHGVIILGLPAENKQIDVLRNGNFVSTAEHTILLILTAARNFYVSCHTLKNEKWEKYRFVGEEVYEKTLGIIGLGRVGKLVAKRATALGMKVIAYDPYISSEYAKFNNAKLTSLKNLCKKSDFITIHAPKNKETINLINKKSFSLMKKGIIIINAARGAIINEKDLISALKNGRVRSAALDVFENEPNNINFELVRMKNVIATPHIAGSTINALKRISLNTVRNIIDYINKGDIKNAINKIKKI